MIYEQFCLQMCLKLYCMYAILEVFYVKQRIKHTLDYAIKVLYTCYTHVKTATKSKYIYCSSRNNNKIYDSKTCFYNTRSIPITLKYRQLNKTTGIKQLLFIQFDLNINDKTYMTYTLT